MKTHPYKVMSAPAGGGGAGGAGGGGGGAGGGDAGGGSHTLELGLLACGVAVAVAGATGGLTVGAAIVRCAGGMIAVGGADLIKTGLGPTEAGTSGGKPGTIEDPPTEGPDPDTEEGQDGWGGVCGEGAIGGEGAVDDGGGPAGGGCFIAGTAVSTPEGPVPIECLTPDVAVWAGTCPPEVAPRLVERVMTVRSTELLALDFGEETIHCTPTHPFFTGTWTKAGDLASGARVLRRDGHWQTLRSVSKAQSSVPVYNLTVGDLRTFFVGKVELLVHNKEPVQVEEPGDNPWKGSDQP